MPNERKKVQSLQICMEKMIVQDITKTKHVKKHYHQLGYI